MKRLNERKEEYFNAFERLKEALNSEPNDIIIDGVLHRFEFTFELSWKTIKDYLEYLGITNKIGSPREIIQLAFKHGIISDGNSWMQMMLSRNLLSHMYDENASREVYIKIKNEYINLFEELKEMLETI